MYWYWKTHACNLVQFCLFCQELFVLWCATTGRNGRNVEDILRKYGGTIQEILMKYRGNIQEIWRKYGRKGCNAGSIVIIMWCDGWAGAACNNSIHGRHHSSRRSTLDIIVQIFYILLFRYSRYYCPDILDIIKVFWMFLNCWIFFL